MIDAGDTWAAVDPEAADPDAAGPDGAELDAADGDCAVPGRLLVPPVLPPKPGA
jgi:hypothetical protein